MKHLLALLFGLCATAVALGDVAPADFALVNGRIYTETEWAPWAHAVAIKGDRIVFVGEPGTAEWNRLIGPHTRVHDLGGHLVFPAFVDSHTHPRSAALSAWHTILPYTQDTDEQLRYIAKWAAEHPNQPVIEADYYPTQAFGAAGPNKALIDRYISDRPVIWQDLSGHSTCLNSKALELMGIDRNTPDPEPGTSYFVRDKAGNPTGWVKERAYAALLPKLWAAVKWSPPDAVPADDLARTLDFLTDHGVGTVFDALGTEDTFVALASLERAHRLHVYYEGSIRYSTLKELPERVADLHDWQRKYGSRHVHVNTVKLFLDGTNEIATSALLEPFASDPGNSGEMRMSKPDLVRSLVYLNEAGVDLHIHMVGDRAFRVALDAVEEARRQIGKDWRMHVTFAHCELIADEDFHRVAELGVFINFTPQWAGGYIEGSMETLGKSRFDNMYRFQPIISTGGTMTFGSDTVSLYEWDRANPFVGIEIGHTRRDSEPRYQQPDGLRKSASEMLQIRDLVQGYTINGARQLRLDTLLGSIAPGKLANLTVLDRDIFAVAPSEIHSTESIAVMFEGKVIKGALPTHGR